eukprot:GHRR01036368.1.p1 GENE.GHRR01036368.1~~GHRR01036368.1.p1  ORF type:complete len:173 (-),score=36.64 GHRR01036368.1:82-600(-)
MYQLVVLRYNLPFHGYHLLQVRVGICAMDKKANSKPMREIIGRLVAYGEFEVVNFGDELILHHPITEWPRVDCLMSWYSDGFPLGKAQEYADATRPFLINDLHMQVTVIFGRPCFALQVVLACLEDCIYIVLFTAWPSSVWLLVLYYEGSPTHCTDPGYGCTGSGSTTGCSY